MQTATAPFILRSIYKDDYVTETQLTRPVVELMTSTVGAQWTNRYDANISPATRGLYTFFTMLKGQTLGEEFCDILPVTRGASWRSVGITRKLILATLQAVEPSVLFLGARKLFPSVPPHDVIANLYKVVMCLLFLFERFGTIPHRLTCIRYLSLKPAQVLNNGDGAPRSYFILGLVLLVELVVRLWRFVKSRQSAAKDRQSYVGDRESVSSSEEERQVGVVGHCMLCLSHRKCPTATQCGHIFCWQCIAEWIQSNPREALCPFCRQHITAQSLVPLYFYVAKEAPRVGTASDAPQE